MKHKRKQEKLVGVRVETWPSRLHPTLQDVEEVLHSLFLWTQQFSSITDPCKSELADKALALLATATNVEWMRKEEEARQSYEAGNPDGLALRLHYWDEVRKHLKRGLDLEEAIAVANREN